MRRQRCADALSAHRLLMHMLWSSGSLLFLSPLPRLLPPLLPCLAPLSQAFVSLLLRSARVPRRRPVALRAMAALLQAAPHFNRR